MPQIMDQEAVIADIERRARMAGVSISELCRQAGVHPTTFSRWKKSPRNPEPLGATFKTIKKLDNQLRVIAASRRPASRKAVQA
jgi:hypothetical protein